MRIEAIHTQTLTKLKTPPVRWIYSSSMNLGPKNYRSTASGKLAIEDGHEQFVDLPIKNGDCA